MTKVQSTALPPDSLLHRYSETGYADCFFVDVPGQQELASFVGAFYISWLFRLERFILRLAAKRPSSDKDVAALAAGETDRFAAWTVEARSAQQLLMCDMAGRTRSWFMVETSAANTRLYFGSAVVPIRKKDGTATLGWGFSALLGAHKCYSVLLLRACARRMAQAG